MTAGAGFACPLCGAASSDPADAANRYCRRCHVFVDDVLDTPPAHRARLAEHFRRRAAQQPERAGHWLGLARTWEPRA